MTSWSGAGSAVVVAPDKFKGSLTAPEAAAHIAAGLRRSDPDVQIRLVPVADGGEGTVQALAASGYTLEPVVVSGPTGQPVDACFVHRGDTAVVELAEASGMRRLPDGRPDPMGSSSRGTGELICAALDGSCRRVILGVGGSATTDGGAGMLQALGVRVLDGGGRDLAPGGGSLAEVRAVDLDGLDARLAGTTVTLASDVDNPLLGAQGTAQVYARQKGAGDDQVRALEDGLRQWAQILAAATGRDVSGSAGAGAAGGVGFAALAVLRAERLAGVEIVLKLIGFDDLLTGARLVITGEGCLDAQSLRGKAPVGVARAAAGRGVEAIAVVGRCSLTGEQLASAGLRAAYSLSSLQPDLAACERDAGRLLEQLVANVASRHLRP